MISANVVHIQSYLADKHPNVAQEVQAKFTSIKCNKALVNRICTQASSLTDERWEHQVVSIAAVLLLCSPETIHVGCAVRRSSGAVTLLGKYFGVSHVSISKKIERSRHYYTHVSWCKEAVDKIVKEMRGE